MKLFGKRAEVPARPVLVRPMGGGIVGGEWPRSYEAQVRDAYLGNPIAQRAVRIVAEGASGVPVYRRRAAHELSRHAICAPIGRVRRERARPLIPQHDRSEHGADMDARAPEACVTAAADPVVAGGAAREEAKTYLRIEGAADDALLDRLIAAAIGHGEALTGRLWLARTVRENVAPVAEWRRLGATPVRSVAPVEGVPAQAYAIDIDAAGDGWIRFAAAATGPVALAYQAGIAADWSGLPEPLRQGALRLAAHLYTHRDGDDGSAPPAAVVAFWRPWRRMRLG